uniref:Uncharacterized protein n=1 Tax=Pyxicephalus adspersus TaxID=30357 RepID=A0AAV2ZP67_PYXAD|nr:TPA: hypothetical protein GDO54_003234 [Pyxicephalus adspersus]
MDETMSQSFYFRAQKFNDRPRASKSGGECNTLYIGEEAFGKENPTSTSPGSDDHLVDLTKDSNGSVGAELDRISNEGKEDYVISPDVTDNNTDESEIGDSSRQMVDNHTFMGDKGDPSSLLNTGSKNSFTFCIQSPFNVTKARTWYEDTFERPNPVGASQSYEIIDNIYTDPLNIKSDDYSVNLTQDSNGSAGTELDSSANDSREDNINSPEVPDNNNDNAETGESSSQMVEIHTFLGDKRDSNSMLDTESKNSFPCCNQHSSDVPEESKWYEDTYERQNPMGNSQRYKDEIKENICNDPSNTESDDHSVNFTQNSNGSVGAELDNREDNAIPAEVPELVNNTDKLEFGDSSRQMVEIYTFMGDKGDSVDLTQDSNGSGEAGLGSRENNAIPAEVSNLDNNRDEHEMGESSSQMMEIQTFMGDKEDSDSLLDTGSKNSFPFYNQHPFNVTEGSKWYEDTFGRQNPTGASQEHEAEIKENIYTDPSNTKSDDHSVNLTQNSNDSVDAELDSSAIDSREDNVNSPEVLELDNNNDESDMGDSLSQMVEIHLFMADRGDSVNLTQDSNGSVDSELDSKADNAISAEVPKLDNNKDEAEIDNASSQMVEIHTFKGDSSFMLENSLPFCNQHSSDVTEDSKLYKDTIERQNLFGVLCYEAEIICNDSSNVRSDDHSVNPELNDNGTKGSSESDNQISVGDKIDKGSLLHTRPKDSPCFSTQPHANGTVDDGLYEDNLEGQEPTVTGPEYHVEDNAMLLKICVTNKTKKEQISFNLQDEKWPRPSKTEQQNEIEGMNISCESQVKKRLKAFRNKPDKDELDRNISCEFQDKEPRDLYRPKKADSSNPMLMHLPSMDDKMETSSYLGTRSKKSSSFSNQSLKSEIKDKKYDTDTSKGQKPIGGLETLPADKTLTNLESHHRVSSNNVPKSRVFNVSNTNTKIQGKRVDFNASKTKNSSPNTAKRHMERTGMPKKAKKGSKNQNAKLLCQPSKPNMPKNKTKILQPKREVKAFNKPENYINIPEDEESIRTNESEERVRSHKPKVYGKAKSYIGVVKWLLGLSLGMLIMTPVKATTSTSALTTWQQYLFCKEGDTLTNQTVVIKSLDRLLDPGYDCKLSQVLYFNCSLINALAFINGTCLEMFAIENQKQLWIVEYGKKFEGDTIEAVRGELYRNKQVMDKWKVYTRNDEDPNSMTLKQLLTNPSPSPPGTATSDRTFRIYIVCGSAGVTIMAAALLFYFCKRGKNMINGQPLVTEYI